MKTKSRTNADVERTLLGNSPKPITKIIDSQLDIELGQFTQEFNVVLKKQKQKAARPRRNTRSKEI